MSWVRRSLSTSRPLNHGNPLGLPQRPVAPELPRRGGVISKRPIPNVQKVLAVASGKGGVGKSTIAMNLAFELSMRKNKRTNAPLSVGILDLDIFGPSIPTLMGLQNAGEPALTEKGAIIPLTNVLPCMSMGFLLPPSSSSSSSTNVDTAVVWRGLMVQKAVQQLLFDVDWSMDGRLPGLDVLVVDMPPGTGDVPLTLGQLVKVDGAVIVSTPQDVSLSDVRKGIAMLKKVSVPIAGLVLNHAYYLCPTCDSPTPRYIYGKPDNFRNVTRQLSIPVLAELPVVEGVSGASDAGKPYVLMGATVDDGEAGVRWKKGMSTATGPVICMPSFTPDAELDLLFPLELISSKVKAELGPDLHLRPLAKTDHTRSHFSVLSVLTSTPPVSETDYTTTFENLRRTPNTYFTLVIIHKPTDQIVGVGCVFVEQKFIRGLGKVGHIEDIAVDKGMQGKKLGLRIIQALTEISERVGCYKTILNCSDSNIPFYQKCGFEKREHEMALYHKNSASAPATNVQDRPLTPHL